MKVKLVKPLPQAPLNRVVPAGAVIDAPPALYARILRQGLGKPLPGGDRKPKGKKVRRDG